jgi:hypothetical protein
MIRLALLFVGVSILPQAAHATPITLTPPASSLFIGSGGGLGDNRGAYVTATANFDVTHIGIALSLFPSADTTLIANVYAASGFARGALLSSATASIQGTGTAIGFYDVPISFGFASGVDYDISISFPNWHFPQGDPAIDLVRYYEFEPFFGAVPFNVAGLVTVRDGEASGCAQCNGLLPHLQLTVAEPVPEPTAWTLLATGLICLALMRGRESLLPSVHDRDKSTYEPTDSTSRPTATTSNAAAAVDAPWLASTNAFRL